MTRRHSIWQDALKQWKKGKRQSQIRGLLPGKKKEKERERWDDELQMWQRRLCWKPAINRSMKQWHHPGRRTQSLGLCCVTHFHSVYPWALKEHVLPLYYSSNPFLSKSINLGSTLKIVMVMLMEKSLCSPRMNVNECTSWLHNNALTKPNFNISIINGDCEFSMLTFCTMDKSTECHWFELQEVSAHRLEIVHHKTTALWVLLSGLYAKLS